MPVAPRTDVNGDSMLDETKNAQKVVLQANSGVDIGDVDVTSIAAGDNNIGNVDIASALPAGTNVIGKVQPFSAILEGGLTELIDKDDTEVSQNDYSKSVGVALGGTYSGAITQVSLYATELGTGAVRANTGYLLIFDADPAVVAGETALTVAEWQSCIAKVLISDWISDTGGGLATMEVNVPFHALGTLYFVFQNLGTAFNDAAEDDEELHVNFWYKRET